MEALEDMHSNHVKTKKGKMKEKKTIEKKGNGKMTNKKIDEALFGEVGDLAKHLNGIYAKINSAESFLEDASAQLPMGTGQLSEVTRKTEEATQQILDDTEKILGNHDLMGTRLESLKATLFDESLDGLMMIKEDIKALSALLEDNKQVMFNLVTTLSFQDPAGQEIKKVESMLQGLQSRLLKMIITFGEKVKGNEVSEDRGEALLTKLEDSNKDERLNQDLVDTVLKEYGF